jgi:predicted alpha/beta-hydrolase family hydrolase
MTKEPEKLIVSVNESDAVTALLYLAAKKDRAGLTIILGHGAGGNQLTPFMRLFTSGLAERGFDTMTFNFLYMEQGRRVPDPKAKLESCYLAVIEAARRHKKLKDNHLVIGGKSMGGRIASQVAALERVDLSGLSKAATTASERGRRTVDAAARSTPVSDARLRRKAPLGENKTRATVKTNNIAALVLLGYPLHPPGRPEQLRDAHLKDIRAPMLFLQGSRDAFGTPEELKAVIKRLRLPATLQVIEDGDHSLKVPKRTAITQQQVYHCAMDNIVRWLKTEVGKLKR